MTTDTSKDKIQALSDRIEEDQDEFAGLIGLESPTDSNLLNLTAEDMIESAESFGEVLTKEDADLLVWAASESRGDLRGAAQHLYWAAK